MSNTLELVENKQLKERAKLMYLSRYEIEDIMAKLSLPESLVREWVLGKDGKATDTHCWAAIRARVSESAITTFIIDRQMVFDRSSGLALECLTKGLERLNERVSSGEHTLDVDEIRKLAAVVKDMDHVGRLESGKATTIVETTTGLTPEKIREIIKNDPILDIVDVEYRELEDE
jgi:hypothetical protein